MDLRIRCDGVTPLVLGSHSLAASQPCSLVRVGPCVGAPRAFCIIKGKKAFVFQVVQNIDDFLSSGKIQIDSLMLTSLDIMDSLLTVTHRFGEP